MEISTILLKAVSSCNLRCTYCYAHCPHNKPEVMPAAQAVKLIRTLADHGDLARDFEVVWHGGEPTLYPPDQARDIMDAIRDIARSHGLSPTFGMQSNGFHITPQWLDLIQQYQIGIGISMDGPQDIHDAARKAPTPGGSYQTILKTIQTLRQRQQQVSLLAVIDRRHAGHEQEFFRWIVHMDTDIRLNPGFDARGNTADAWQDYFHFLREIFNLALTSDLLLKHPIQPLDWMLKSILTGAKPRECAYAGTCGSTILSVSPQGKLLPCGRLEDAPELATAITDHLVQDMANARQNLKDMRQRIRNQCQCNKCPYNSLCHGFCPAVRRYDTSPRDFCNPFIHFMDYLKGDGLRLLRQIAVRQRQQLMQHTTIS